MLSIRPVAPNDIDAVLTLEAATPEAPHWTRTAYATYLNDEGRRLFIAEAGNSLIGYIAGYRISDICELESIAVSGSARRAGTGTALLAALTAWAQSLAVAQLQLEVRAGNRSAIEFYARSGFLPDGLRPGYYQNPSEDAILMSRPLVSHPAP